MATTLYIIVTMILFSLNLMANLAVMGMNKNEKFPFAAFFASLASIAFVVWAIVLLIA
jgi:hypothetical protein